MRRFTELLKAGNSSEAGAAYLVRWRGVQSGPYPPATIEAKLLANEIGMSHEILHRGQWLTIRDFMAEHEASLQTELKARQEAAQRAQTEAERKERERLEQHRAATLAEERRKNDLLAADLVRQPHPRILPPTPQGALKAHRGGLVLTLGLVGLVCVPLCMAAWIMGSGDLAEMDAGLMDPSGRSTTSTGKSLGVIGTMLWVIGFIFILALQK